ncbi:hypothetical protein IC582_002353 [Cucumis melo]|uniref:Protein SOGA3-like n=2 Tax=Cucumis melo TaxID=3656 RepID=A0A9I9DTC8_CUCME
MNDMDHTQILMNHNFVVWTQPPNLPPVLPLENRGMFPQASQRSLSTPPTSIHGRCFRKGKRPDMRRKDLTATPYKTSNWNELQYQNRLKSRRFYPKKKSNYRFPPFAPRNTTSFLIRAKRSGGIASLVSPYPVTPAVLPTPIFSPLREVLVDMAKEEWGLDGYGSMKGLIRLRSAKDYEDEDEEEEEDEVGESGDSDVEGHLEVERRLDHDLSRFEMICPTSVGEEQSTLLENRVDDRDCHISRLEEENLTLKERVFFMERELEDLRRRVQCLETEGWRFHLTDNNKEETAASENAFDNGGNDHACSEKSINDIGNE